MFLEIIGGLANVASISGITAKELIPFISDPDKKLFEKYFSYLEGKKVLTAPFDSEVSQAVIKSLESIKDKTEQLRLDIKSKQAQHLILDLIHTLSQNLMLLYKHHPTHCADGFHCNVRSPLQDYAMPFLHSVSA